MSSQRSRTSAEIHGISLTDIKDMIDHLYGACLWTIDEHGDRVCYPTADSSVTVHIERPERVEKDQE